MLHMNPVFYFASDVEMDTRYFQVLRGVPFHDG